ncbi:hypothetical protein GCM10020229_45750 [Kitasatospora albolonga]|uniref:GntR family transcriptional regulator n=1 Tax=Kitasatospora albolonga TaxID=68173 RepID=UPI0031E94F7F
MAGSSFPFTRIADHFRAAILSGDMEPGEKLPSQRELCQRFNVASATVGKALGQLAVEGLIRTTARGTFVADGPVSAATGRDRLLQVQRLRSTHMAGESTIVTAAQLKVPDHLYVADIFDLDSGDQLVHREFTTGKGRVRLMFAASYHPAEFAAQVPDLLSTAPGKHAGLLGKILDATGRTITHARDDMHGRAAKAKEASMLGIPVGAPVLAGVHRWSDAQGVIEYGEWVIPTQHTIGYEYDPRNLGT